MIIENLKVKLEEKVLEEHQRESGLHVIGGRARLVERLLKLLDQPFLGTANADHQSPQESGRCGQ